MLDEDERARGVGRCELGYNWNEDTDPGTGIAGPGPTVFYDEGERLVTFAFDVAYSSDPAKGSIRIYADLNGDGDAEDDDERSPELRLATLRPETAGRQDAVAPGEGIPSHLRAGLYQNRNYGCPPPQGCYMDIDNVQVVAAD